MLGTLGGMPLRRVPSAESGPDFGEPSVGARSRESDALLICMSKSSLKLGLGFPKTTESHQR